MQPLNTGVWNRDQTLHCDILLKKSRPYKLLIGYASLDHSHPFLSFYSIYCRVLSEILSLFALPCILAPIYDFCRVIDYKTEVEITFIIDVAFMEGQEQNFQLGIIRFHHLLVWSQSRGPDFTANTSLDIKL